jgi:squalene cyclase
MVLEAGRRRRALARGVEFLLDRQCEDGLWRDFQTPAGEASTWPTAYIGTALYGVGIGGAAAERAASALVSRQHRDGGWGYNEETPTDADSTSWALLLLTRTRDRSGACQRAGRCLARHQRRHSGGVATYAEAGPIRRYMGLARWVPYRGWCRPQTEVTAVAGRAQDALGSGAPRARAAAAWRYVRHRQEADGSWSSYWWTTPHYATQQAVALAVCMHDLDAIRQATGWAIRTQRPDGGWGVPGAAVPSSFTTALSLSVLAVSDLDVQMPLTRARDALVGLQRADGGWPSAAALRIPMPSDASRSGKRQGLVQFAPGIVVVDHHRTFTTATCVAALTAASGPSGTSCLVQ